MARHAYLVWDYVEGAPLEAIAPNLPTHEATRILREIGSIVQTLHALGIVHGAIHARNIIIDEFGRVRLTHVSPLLFSDKRTITIVRATCCRGLRVPHPSAISERRRRDGTESAPQG